MPRAELESGGDRIDVDSVPAIRPGIVTADLGGELVLHDSMRDSTRRLGATASVVWHCIDGTSTIGELADDVLAVQGGERSQIVAQLVRHVRSFSKAGLLRGAGQPMGTDTELVGPCATTTPSQVPADPCAHSNRFGWVGGLTVVVGNHLLGIRCNDADLLALLGRLFGPITVDVADPEPNFSVRLGQPGRAHRLQEGCRTVVHSNSLERVVTALCASLSVYTEQRRDDRVLLDAALVARRDAAILVPQRLRPRLGGAEQHLTDRGLVLADALPALTLDGSSVTIAPPVVPADWPAFERLRQLTAEPVHSPPAALPGSYRLAGWAWPGPSGGGAPTRAYVATAANRAVRNRRAVGAERALTVLVAALTATDLRPLPVGSVPTGHVLDAITGVG